MIFKKIQKSSTLQNKLTSDIGALISILHFDKHKIDGGVLLCLNRTHVSDSFFLRHLKCWSFALVAFRAVSLRCVLSVSACSGQ